MRVFFLTIILLSSLNSFSQEEISEKPKNEIKLSVTGFLKNTFTLGYERFFNNTSVVLNQGIKFDAYNLGNYSELQYRFYLHLKHKNNKFVKIDAIYFTLPYLIYEYNDQESSRISDSSRHYYQESYGAGLLAGIKISFGNRITFDFNLGTGYTNYKSTGGVFSYYYNDNISNFKGIMPKGKILFGYKF